MVLLYMTIYGNMDPINIPPMLAYIPYMDPMGMAKKITHPLRFKNPALGLQKFSIVSQA